MAKWRPTLFSDLQALKFVDLRWNSISHMEKPLLAGEHFKGLYLTGKSNAFYDYRRHVSDLQSLGISFKIIRGTVRLICGGY